MTTTTPIGPRKPATGSAKNNSPCPLPPTGKRPNLKVRKIGVVSRNYWDRLPRKFDFSGKLKAVLRRLNNKKCDAVLFSLWSIIRPFSVKEHLSGMKNLRHIKTVLYEEFELNEDISKKDIPKQKNFPGKRSRFVVCYRKNGGWHEYKFNQIFGSLNPRPKDRRDAKDAGWKVDDWMDAKAKCLICRLPGRVLGNCCVILCGESNIVRRRGKGKDLKIHDESHIKKAMPKNVRIILNPVHDRMGHRMNRKRKFLSEPNRWVLSFGTREGGTKTANEELLGWFSEMENWKPKPSRSLRILPRD